MSLFSTELTRVVENMGAQQDFAARIGWAPGIVSGYMTGRRVPKRGQLAKILAAAGRHNAPGLLQAYLQDFIPPGCGNYLTFTVCKGAGRREVVEDYALPKLLEASMKGLRRKAATSKPVADFILAYAETLRLVNNGPDPDLKRKRPSKRRKE